MAVNTSSKWKITTPQAGEVNDPPLYYKNIVQNIEDVAAGAAQLVADAAARDAIPAAQLYPGKRVRLLSDNSEYDWNGTAWVATTLPWTAYTPTWTNLTVGNGVVTAAWARAGGSVMAKIRITFGTTTVVSGFFYPSTPVSINPDQVGIARAFDLSATAWAVGAFTPTGYVILKDARASATAPWTWAAGDIIDIAITAAA